MQRNMVLWAICPIFILLLISSNAIAQDSQTKYVELISKEVNSLDAPYGTPQVFEEIIETSGYSEIRMFIHVFVKNYQNTPVTGNTELQAKLFHHAGNGSWYYAGHKIKSDVTSYIDGWFSEKIIGNRLRIVCSVKNLPQGPYYVIVTYYLVR